MSGVCPVNAPYRTIKLLAGGVSSVARRRNRAAMRFVHHCCRCGSAADEQRGALGRGRSRRAWCGHGRP
eukprot:7566231-Lingulodinium_polyedra.AAC.1